MTERNDWRDGKPTFVEKLEYLINSKVISEDVTFLVGEAEEEIRAFKLILVAQSPVFEVMFSAPWNNNSPSDLTSTSIPKMPDIQPTVFRIFLKLLLKNKLEMEHLKELEISVVDVLHLFYIAKKYDVTSVKAACESLLQGEINLENVICIFENIQGMDEETLENAAFIFIVKNISTLLTNESFLEQLSRKSLARILGSEKLTTSELILFQGACGWAEIWCRKFGLEAVDVNVRAMLADCIYLLRFPFISAKDFSEFVCSTGVLSQNEALQILRYIVLPKDKRDPKVVEGLGFSTKDRKGRLDEEKLKQEMYDHFVQMNERFDRILTRLS